MILILKFYKFYIKLQTSIDKLGFIMNYILLKLPNWLGDTIMLTPTIECLRRVFKNVKFIVVGNSLSTSMFETSEDIVKIFIDKSKETKGFIKRLDSTINLAFNINQYLRENDIESIDCAITFQNNFFSAFLLSKINAMKKVGYGDKNIFGIRRFLLTHAVKYISGRPPICNHQVLSYINLLLAVLPYDFFKHNMESNSIHHNDRASSVQNVLFAQAKELKLFLQINTTKKSNNIIGISCGASYGSSKMWLEKYFTETIADLAKNGFHIRIYGSKNEAEKNENIQNNAIKLLSDKFHKNIINLSGKTDLKELANSLNECSLYIGNDSGTTHIARALNIPSIVLFGPMPFEWCNPWSSKESTYKRNDCYYTDNIVAIRKEIPCSPCKKKVCPLKHHNCMKLITPDEVLEIAYDLLCFNTKQH